MYETFNTNSVMETESVAVNWLHGLVKEVADEKTKEATIIGLSGHLGAGKTVFAKLIAKELRISEEITSPTFVIMKFYEISNPTVPWKRLVHIDAYRLERKEELNALRFEEVVSDPNNLVLVEWPEQVGLEFFGEKQRLYFEMKEGVCTIRIAKK